MSMTFPSTSVHREERPWGAFHRYVHHAHVTVKIIAIEPGRALSLHRHALRSEQWVVLDDGVQIELGGLCWTAARGEIVHIPRGAAHRLSSVGGHVRVLELAFGHCDEDDVERLDDRYGRV